MRIHLEVYLPKKDQASPGCKVIGASTKEDIEWGGSLHEGESFVVSEKGGALPILKITHWSATLSGFEQDFISLQFEASPEFVGQLLEKSEVWQEEIP